MSRKNTHPDQEVMDDVNADVAQENEATEAAEGSQEELVAQLAAAETKAAEYLDSLQRERATFQNYKKRVERERAEQAKNIAGNVLLRLLPVLDDFYRAMDAVPEHEQNDWYNGMAMILRKLERYLADQNVSEIEALGQPFDPNFHEAVSVDTDSDAESGTVTDVLQRGYMHGERVLRPSMVRVAE